MERTLDVIELRKLEVECLIGVYPRERVTPQKLVLDVALETDSRPAGLGAGLEATIDYSQIAGELTFILEGAHFELIEEAAEALAAWLLSPGKVRKNQSRIHRVRVSIEKPEAMGGFATPTITISREPSDYKYEVEESVFGNVDIIYEIDALGLYELRVAPGKAIPPHYHKLMDEAELVLDSGIKCQNEMMKPGVAHVWPRLLVHTYENVSEREASILCIDRPKFIRDDEIETDEPLGDRLLGCPKRYFGQEEPV